MSDQATRPLRETADAIRDGLERKTLLDFLQTEIQRTESSSKRPGWNIWVLCAAMAALFSYLLAALESGMPSWPSVGTIYVLIYVGFVTVHRFVAFSSGRRDDPELRRRFETGSAALAGSRLWMCTWLIQTIAAFLVFQASQSDVPIIFLRSLQLFLGLECLFALDAFIASFLRQTLPRYQRQRWWILLLFCAMWVGSGALACIGLGQLLSSVVPTVQEWQVAGALAGISVVIGFMAQEPHAPALLEDLRQVERRLVIGKIGVAVAQEKVDRILWGQTIGDLMGPLASDVIRNVGLLEQAVSSYCDKARGVCGRTDELLGRPDEATRVRAELLLELKDLDQRIISVGDSLDQLRKKTMAALRQSPHLDQEALLSLGEIHERFSSLNYKPSQELSEVKEAIREFVQAIEEDPAAM